MPEFFVPARNSRHRTACFALYKALLRQATTVPLLSDKLTLSDAVAPDDPFLKAPIRTVIRRSFRQNRQDTSPRLVLRSLENGYKFLDLLSEAQTPSSPATKSIVDFLQEHAFQFTTEAKEAARERHAHKQRQKVTQITKGGNKKTRERVTQPSAPRKGHVPLLTRRPIPNTGGQSKDNRFLYYYYEYVPTSRPWPLQRLEQTVSDGRRRVPVFATDSNGIPFLRLQKPQSPMLSRVLRQKGNKRQERMMLASKLQYEEVEFATEEDRWEKLIHEQLVVRENDEANGGYSVPEYSAATYAHSVWVGVTYLNSKLNAEVADIMARSKALMQIVNEEQALADKEEKDRREQTLLEAMQEQAETNTASPPRS